MVAHVTTAHREGFPRAAMEAAAIGLPAVVTDIRGCRQVVDDEATGLLVPARDVAALETAIATLASDPERRRAMGAAARAKALRQFDVKRCVDIILSTYERLLDERGSSRVPTAP
jgi:glycosyltransferase involved in cell wall biosynthesis